MRNSINQPWAISEKYSNRYGELWANLDFQVNDQITTKQFKSDPMNTEVGLLHIDNRALDLKYKDILGYAKSADEMFNTIREMGNYAPSVHEFAIKGRVFQLKKHEVSKLASTLNDAVQVISRKYELGLYL